MIPCHPSGDCFASVDSFTASENTCHVRGPPWFVSEFEECSFDKAGKTCCDIHGIICWNGAAVC